MNKSMCIVDGSYGIYVPQRYSVLCSAHDMCTDEQRDILAMGPHQNPNEYWEVWQEVLDNTHVKRGNSYWHLEISDSGDVLLVQDNWNND